MFIIINLTCNDNYESYYMGLLVDLFGPENCDAKHNQLIPEWEVFK